jgi:hypothetical protein
VLDVPAVLQHKPGCVALLFVVVVHHVYRGGGKAGVSELAL